MIARLLQLSPLLVLPVTLTANEWTSIGPPGGTPVRFQLPPASSGYEQLAATIRLLFKRTPDGEWIPVSPDYGGLTTWTINDIAVAPSDPSRLYFLRSGPYTGTAIYRTLDGGISWDQVVLPVPPEEHYVYCLAIHPENRDTLFAGSYSALFRSEDAGDSWVEIGGALPSDPIPTDFAIRPDNPSILLMGSRGDDPGIYRSFDLGETWDRVFADDDVGQLVVSPKDPLVILARSEHLAGSSLIYRSTDGGSSWSLWSSDPRLANHLVIDPNDSQKMYCLGYEEGGARPVILASVDGGMNWFVITSTDEVEASSFKSLGISPGNMGDLPALFLGANFWGVFRSTDDGASWGQERFFSAYIGAVAQDPDHSMRLYIGTAAALNQSLANGRLFVSEDGGESWLYVGESDDPSSHPVGRVWAIAPSLHVSDRVWVGTSYGLFLSEDAGRTLTHTGSGVVRSIWEDPIDPGHVLFGTAWSPTIPPIPPKLVQTTDGGVSWVELRQFEQAVMDIDVDTTDGRIYCALGTLSLSGLSGAGAGGLFWWESGGGWHEMPDLAGLHISDLVIDPDDPNHLLAATMDSGVLVSMDRGVNWTPMNTGLADTAVHVMEALDLSGTEVDLVIGTWSGTHRWEGGHWVPLSEGMIAFPSGGDSVALQTTALDFDPLTEQLYVGTSGRSAYTLDMATVTGIRDEKNAGYDRLPKVVVLHQNHPNPFNPSTTIAFSLSGERNEEHTVTLNVYDIRGRLVKNLVNSVLRSGYHEVVWKGRDERGRDVSSGIYLYILKVDGISFSRKMLALK